MGRKKTRPYVSSGTVYIPFGEKLEAAMSKESFSEKIDIEPPSRREQS